MKLYPTILSDLTLILAHSPAFREIFLPRKADWS